MIMENEFRSFSILFYMALPFFYSDIQADSRQLVLNEETSKHVVQVLRMHNGDQLNLTDGTGNLFLAEIIDDHKKKCSVRIISTSYHQPSEKKIRIAISLIKNNSRLEWFLEKVTELGVHEIIPMLCARTEKSHFRYDRMHSILVSAMLQSQQCWLPQLQEPVKFDKLVTKGYEGGKFIAHCLDENTRRSLFSFQPFNSTIILIGPEGDFTNEEISMAKENGFHLVSLGETRLRTETAGLVAAVAVCNF